MQQALKWSIFLAAAAGIVYLCLRMLQPFLLVIAWSVVLAILFHPLYRRLARKTGRVTLSALLTSALVVLLFVVPLLVVAGVAVSQMASAAQGLQERLRSGANPADLAIVRWAADHVGIDDATVAAWLNEHTSQLAGTAGEYTMSIATSVTGAIVSFGFTILATFMLLLDGAGLVAAIPDLLPFDPGRSRELLVRIREAIQGSVYGVAVMAVLHGVLGGALFWLVGIPSAALCGMLIALTSVLPVVGASAVWVPAVIYLLAHEAWSRGIALGLLSAVLFSGTDHVLRPRLVAGRVGLNQTTMFFALLGGVHLFGILGIVLGPVIFATADSIVRILRTPAAATAPV